MPTKYYYLKFQDETAQEAYEAHNEPYNTMLEAIKDTSTLEKGTPYVVLDDDLNVVHTGKAQDVFGTA